MTDPVTREFYPVPELTIVDPSPGTVRNGQCAPDGFGNNRNNQQQQHVRSPVRHEPLTTGQEMKIADSVEGEGLLESSLRLKPHEAQNYRKKALWVSWISIVVTLILAVTAFMSRCVARQRRTGLDLPPTVKVATGGPAQQG